MTADLREPVPGQPLILAHRGLSGLYPENTMAAFRAALAGHGTGADKGKSRSGASAGTETESAKGAGSARAHGLELDVVFSKDDVPMVIHDETLARTTDGAGRVEDFSCEELQQLDAGSWFSPDYQGEPIPTLQQVLQEFGSSAIINIEIKPQLKPPYKEKHLRAIVELVERHRMEHSVIVSSFAHRALAALRQISPDINLSLLYDYLPGDEDAAERLSQLNGYALHLRADLVTPEWLAGWQNIWCRQDAPPVLCWTLDEPERARQLFGWGVSGIFTNRPDLY